jgi:hypothetical protein
VGGRPLKPTFFSTEKWVVGVYSTRQRWAVVKRGRLARLLIETLLHLVLMGAIAVVALRAHHEILSAPTITILGGLMVAVLRRER